MATQQDNLQEEIKKLELQLAEKTALLNKQQVEKINTLVNSFIADVEKNQFSKVEVKKVLIAKLTRKSKLRK